MVDWKAFEQDSYHFELAFRYSGWELELGARPAALWRISSKGQLLTCSRWSARSNDATDSGLLSEIRTDRRSEQ